MLAETKTNHDSSNPRWVANAHAKPAVVLFIIVCHAGALAAPWTFSWAGLASSIILYYLSMGVGITLGFHRLFAHRSYRAPQWFKIAVGTLGCLSLQSGPIRWALTHRLHHRFSDSKDDPHSPRVNFFWAHTGWNFYWSPEHLGLPGHHRFARDLYADPVARLLERGFLPINAASIVLLLCIGVFAGDVPMGLSLVTWGFALRVVLVWHGTWLVNSATHTWGYRTFATNDASRNLWWVALLTFGEGWHNNHHAHPTAADHGRRWFEFDFTYCTICLLELVGVISHVKRSTSSRVSDRQKGDPALHDNRYSGRTEEMGTEPNSGGNELNDAHPGKKLR